MPKGQRSWNEDLARFREILTREKLTPFAHDEITDKQLRTLSGREAALLAILRASADDERLRSSIEEHTKQDLRSLHEYVSSIAPDLLTHPRIAEFAARMTANISKSLDDDKDEDSSSGDSSFSPVDDLQSIRASFLYAGGNEESFKLMPLIRLDFELASDKMLTMQFRTDHFAFLSRALLEGFRDTLTKLDTLQRKSILDPQALTGLRQEVAEMEAALGEVSELSKRLLKQVDESAAEKEPQTSPLLR